MGEVDYMYYNFLIENKTSEYKNAEFAETRNKAIISNPSEWELAVARFSIPGIAIPLFIWKPRLFYVGVMNLPVADIGNPGAGTVHWVEVRMRVDQEGTVRAYGDPAILTTERPVFDYQLWIDNVNRAIHDACIAAGVGAANYPYAYYDRDGSVGIFTPDNGASPVSDNWYPYTFGSSTSTRRYLFMSRGLFLQFFSGLEADHSIGFGNRFGNLFPAIGAPTNTDEETFNLRYLVRFVRRETTVYDPNGRFDDVSYDIIDNKMQFDCTFNWTKIRRLVLTTSSLQVENEQIGASVDGRPFFQQMLTDFEIPVGSHPLNRQTIFYQPDHFRWISLLSDNEIRKMDMRIYYQDFQTEELFLLQIPPNYDINIKLIFRRKKMIERLLQKMVKEATDGEVDKETENKRLVRSNIDSGKHTLIPAPTGRPIRPVNAHGNVSASGGTIRGPGNKRY